MRSGNLQKIRGIEHIGGNMEERPKIYIMQLDGEIALQDDKKIQ